MLRLKQKILGKRDDCLDYGINNNLINIARTIQKIKKHKLHDVLVTRNYKSIR